jgi:carbamoyl-phosphate synthase large subunit
MSMPADRRRLLFTGGGGAGSEAIDRLLGDRDEVHFADADPDAKPYAIASGFWHCIPPASAPDFVEQLTRLCRELRADLLVPGVDEELLPIAEARATIGCHVMLPPVEFIAAHLDKLRSNARLASLGIAVPVTETLTGRRAVAFPCIVKPRRGRGSRNVAVVSCEQELQAHVVTSRRPAADFIVQERLQGQEYTVTMVADRMARLRAVVPVKVWLKRGITLRAETDCDEAVVTACAAIHAAQPVAGCFNIQVVKTESGEVKPFEINPRISTTCCLALAAGVNLIDLWLDDQAPDRRHGELAAFENHLRLKRSWHNEFLAAALSDRTQGES